MSYSGVGAMSFSTGIASKTQASSLTNQGARQPLVDVGVDGGIVRSMADALREVSNSIIGGTDPVFHKASYNFVASALNGLRVNSFGRYDPARVRAILVALGPARQSYVDSMIARRSGNLQRVNALNGYTISRLISDIDSGVYAGKAAAPTVALTTTGIRTTNVPGTFAPKPPPPPPVSAAKPEVECTDGYIRDAQGLCVPGAAPPSVNEQKPVDQPVQNGMDPRTNAGSPWLVDDGAAILPSDIVTEPTGTKKFFGLSWPWWAGGAALATGLYIVTRKRVTPNKRRHRRGKGRS